MAPRVISTGSVFIASAWWLTCTEWLQYGAVILRQLSLTHWGRVTHICVSKLVHLWFRLWIVAYSAPSHYLNQWWQIIILTLGTIIKLLIIQNSNVFIKENTFENIFCEMASILSWPQYVEILTMTTPLTVDELWSVPVVFEVSYMHRLYNYWVLCSILF